MSDQHLSLLKEAAGEASFELLHCEECTTGPSIAQIFCAHTDHPWIIMLKCRDHSKHQPWYICSECISPRKRMYTNIQIARHNRVHHKLWIVGKRDRPMSDDDNDCLSSDAASSLIITEDNDSSKEHGSPLIFDFHREESAQYFRRDVDGLGPAYLVGYSVFELNNVASMLDPEDVDLEILIASLAGSLSRGQRAKLAILLGKLVPMLKIPSSISDPTVSPTGEHTPSISPPTRDSPTGQKSESLSITPPTTPALFRSRFMEGKFAILPNLPHPSIRMVDDHAYVSLKEIVSDFLAHGTPHEEADTSFTGVNVTRVGESKRARTIHANAVSLHSGDQPVVLMFNEWQDDFQVLKSNKGQRKGKSVWIKTVTIIPPHGMKEKSLRNTYPVAVGRKGVSHEEVEKLFKKDMEELCNGSAPKFYDKASHSMKSVHAELFVSLSDQPERRGGNYVQLGNSQFHPRFGYNCDFASLTKVLPACKNCYSVLCSTPDGQPVHIDGCEVCTCWEISNNDLLSYPPPEHYPPEMVPPSGKIHPYRMSFDTLSSAVELAHNHLVSAQWSTQSARSYLRASCLSSNAIEFIILHAHNARSFFLLEKHKADQPTAYKSILEERALSPRQFQQWPSPSWWTRGAVLSQHVEASMHLLSGITKSTVRCIQQWTACHGNKTSFLKYALRLLDPVQDLQLPWCKCPSYTGGKLPGWVSEDYMSLSRICKWFYSGLKEIAPDEVFVEPDKPQKKWTKKQNAGWLSQRGIETTGNAADVRDRVKLLMNLPGGPPAPTAPSGGTVHETLGLVLSLSSMMYRLMANSVSETSLFDVDRSIKIFLSRYSTFEKKVSNRNDANQQPPSWVAKYNFPCLLNLADVLSQFGPIRNLWEGGYQGEGYLRKAKPKLANGLKTNWQVNTAKGMLQSTSLDVLVEERCPEVSSYEGKAKRIENAYVYTGVGMVHRKFTYGYPMSVVCLANGVWGCLLKNKRLAPLTLGDFFERRCGLLYFQWEFHIDTDVLVSVEEESIGHYGVLLPLLSTDGTGSFTRNGVYSLVESEWNEMLEDGTIGLQKVIPPID